jgi:hypothetical protein
MNRRSFLLWLGFAPLVTSPAARALAQVAPTAALTTLPAASVVTAGAGLTLEKLMKAKAMLDAADVPTEERWIEVYVPNLNDVITIPGGTYQGREVITLAR